MFVQKFLARNVLWIKNYPSHECISRDICLRVCWTFMRDGEVAV